MELGKGGMEKNKIKIHVRKFLNRNYLAPSIFYQIF